MEAALPCRMRNKKRSNKSQVTVPTKLKRQSMESTLPKDHEDHIAEKGLNSRSQYSSFSCIKR